MDQTEKWLWFKGKVVKSDFESSGKSSAYSSSKVGNFRSLSHGPPQGWRRSFAKGAERGGAWAGSFFRAWGRAHAVTGARRRSQREGGPRGAAVAAAKQPHGRRRDCCHGARHNREKSRVVEEERRAEWSRDGGTPRPTQKHVTCFLKAGDWQLSSAGCQCWWMRERGSEKRYDENKKLERRNDRKDSQASVSKC